MWRRLYQKYQDTSQRLAARARRPYQRRRPDALKRRSSHLLISATRYAYLTRRSREPASVIVIRRAGNSRPTKLVLPSPEVDLRHTTGTQNLPEKRSSAPF